MKHKNNWSDMANLRNKMLSNCNEIVYYDVLKEKLIKRQIQSNILHNYKYYIKIRKIMTIQSIIYY